MASRAKQFTERGNKQHIKRDLQPRSNSTSYRFYSNSTAPYFVESMPDIDYDLGEMYSGTIPISENDTSRQMFFVYQPTTSEPVDEVTVWFNGGPGCSSLEAFFQENGRFVWGWGMYSAIENQYAWTNLTNMLWVEYPVGVGFSTGNVSATTEEETAADFMGFFKNFQKTFGIKNFKIYITGESYAGRYVPYVSSAMMKTNDTTYFDISGLLMYDPCIGQYEYTGQNAPVVPFVQKNAQLLNLNDTFMKQLEASHEYCGYANYTSFFMQFPPPATQPAWDTGYPDMSASGVDCGLWNLVYEAAYQPNPCFNVYEISSQCPILSDPLAYPSDLQYQYPGMGGIYFNRTDVKKAMHAPMDVDWSECSGPVFAGEAGQYGLGDLSADPIQKILPELIDKTKRVLVANGDYDLEILTEGTLLSIQNMTWGGKLGFQSTPSKPIDIKLPDLQYQEVFENSGLGGLDGPGQGIMGIQHYERGLMWAETFQSGHMQPQFQPRSSYRHLQWVLGRIDEL
ncbi:alpha/beta-hydrolase [Aulographum hederae CBS 113979]|uniref:Carboxypeptidase n=1 Tax=Aulographum hederae CBS 113979 TaxID=1176131 RepID=A0A6G1HGK5_9PEZI|nr:alpha/beta-hydrolase [Aulographum hederae CBS 113979]